MFATLENLYQHAREHTPRLLDELERVADAIVLGAASLDTIARRTEPENDVIRLRVDNLHELGESDRNTLAYLLTRTAERFYATAREGVIDGDVIDEHDDGPVT